MSPGEAIDSQSSTNGARGDKRRKKIMRALHDCILDKGYSKTSLADIAQVADMYPSHLLYYYKGKDAILEHYFQNVSNRILQRIDALRMENPKRQIDLLAELFFAGKGITKSEIGFMLECFGVAVHHTELRKDKTNLDEKCKAYLAELFEKTLPGGIISSPKDSAELAYAMLIGLRSAVYFDESLRLSEAHRLFHTAMSNLSGYKS